MATANEKKALWFLAIVALSGSGVRLWRSNLPQVALADSAALAHQIGRVDSVRELRHRKTALRTGPATASAPPAPVDLDRADADEIETLPGVGPALSKRIVALRDSLGGFGRVEALCDVSGVGPGLVEKLRPLVTFTGARRPLNDACDDASKRPRKARVVRTRQPR